jgi:hypothetical protein
VLAARTSEPNGCGCPDDPGPQWLRRDAEAADGTVTPGMLTGITSAMIGLEDPTNSTPSGAGNSER